MHPAPVVSSASPTLNSFGRTGRVRLSPTVAAAVAIFALLALMVAVRVPFPTPIDELQHLSVVAEQKERPSLFRDPGEYRVLRSADPVAWSAQRNYINHPSAYYLALAPAWSLTRSVAVLRLANVGLALAALLLVVVAGLRLFRSRLGQGVFAILAASYPKAAVVAGMINNDNLAACAGAAVFAGVTGMAGGGWWMAAGLALAGWTKLTALIALGAVVACHQAVRLATGRARLWSRETVLLAAGALIGAVPYLVNLAATGRLLWFNADHFRVAPELRTDLDLPGYVRNFLSTLVEKWPASEMSLPFGIALATLAVPLLLAAWSMKRDRDVARIALPYAIALFATLAIQIGFGWTIYREIGDLTIAQTRYYNVLWPGLAFAGAAGAVRLARWGSGAPVAIVLTYLLPTLLGATTILALHAL